MFQQFPMTNFNKNNPFIVIAKRKYDHIMDDIQLFGNICIRYTFINIVFCLIGWILSGMYGYKMDNFLLPILYIILLIINILGIFLFRRKAKYFIKIHPNMQEFDRISSLEVNDILTMNNEDILKCVNGLYELHGEITATRKYYQLFLIIYCIIEMIISIIIGLSLIL